MRGDIFCLFPFGKNKKLHFLYNPEEVWSFYPSKATELVSSSTIKCDGHREVKNWLNKIEDEKYIYIFHLNYEFGHYQYRNQVSYISDDSCLGVLLKFHKSKLSLVEKKLSSNKIGLEEKNWPSFQSYQRAFDLGLNELMSGNCYQYNLTYPFEFKVKNLSKDNIINTYVSVSESKRGRFSMLTYIEKLGKAFWSNTPESLFQLKRGNNQAIIQTLPVKGTIDIKKAGGKEKAWAKLKNSSKDQAELFMITDLLRNDLNKIEEPVCEVLKKKVPLLAPGIMHQMSLIQISLSKEIKLSKIFESLFPGGSITGAPKKRVMEILKRVESRDRGLYCGSTIMAQEGRVDCSINIRTAEIDLNNNLLKYSAGGGITVLSDARAEFEEMMLKVKSFTDIISC